MTCRKTREIKTCQFFHMQKLTKNSSKQNGSNFRKDCKNVTFGKKSFFEFMSSKSSYFEDLCLKIKF